MPDAMPDMVWVEDRSWRTPSQYTRCRMQGCSQPPVADFFRTGRRSSWWAYCADHLFGRKIEGGKVLHGVHPESDAAKRGYTN
jgi:hypothetical protein